ncbi:CAAD domain-containing protein [Nodosilinea sp. PGN35]|uniref:CAAD domain-containing protein n=1 Tax=Nodosilinea sp. PGN35 TaxID=3020489 RepID=UPI0023B287A3|nr:CAAD domain-containing protein [Nodosilinea sp. TSF1-S3]MDF0367346.1 CAAD domain-containing protein [Nodosilinea sp. TSF1-S3]
MSTDFQSDTAYTEFTAPEDPTVIVDNSESSASALGDEASRQIKQVWDRVSVLLGNLPDYVTEFIQRYRRPIVTVGLIVAAFIAVKLVLALLGAVNDVPLLAPTFELIGLIYSGWFLYRYLLKASNRQELLSDIAAIRDQVLGKG